MHRPRRSILLRCRMKEVEALFYTHFHLLKFLSTCNYISKSFNVFVIINILSSHKNTAVHTTNDPDSVRACLAVSVAISVTDGACHTWNCIGVSSSLDLYQESSTKPARLPEAGGLLSLSPRDTNGLAQVCQSMRSANEANKLLKRLIISQENCDYHFCLKTACTLSSWSFSEYVRWKV
jgi:hypothetical protein